MRWRRGGRCGSRNRSRCWRLLVGDVSHVHVELLIALHALRHHDLQLLAGWRCDEQRPSRLETGRARDGERVRVSSIQRLSNGERSESLRVLSSVSFGMITLTATVGAAPCAVATR